jgi:nucleoside-diphosphate-sugar epimerase
MKRQILLTGSSGKLGQAIIKSKKFDNILTPPSHLLDICDPEKIADYFSHYKIDAVIHAAAMARIVPSEVNPDQAIRKNVVGTSNLVLQLLKDESENTTRFIYISTDGVYSGIHGNYREDGPTVPKSKYGWSKLAGECVVNTLKNYCILRTRFFDPENIPFATSADDMFTSKIPVNELVDTIYWVLNSDYIGTLNIGGDRVSDFECHVKYNKAIRPCSRKEIAKDVTFELPTDISMDTTKYKKLKFISNTL